MAIYNEILTARFARALQKLTGIKGGVPAKQLSGEIMPVFPLFWGSELRYVESWQRFAANLSVSAAAGFPGFAQWRNPTGSNTVAIFEKISFANANATAQQMNLYGPQPRQLDYGNTFPAASTFCRLDARGIQNTQLVATWTNSQASVGLPALLIANTVLPATTGFYDYVVTDIQEITLLPGDTLQVGTSNANQILSCDFIWRERQLEESERT